MARPGPGLASARPVQCGLSLSANPGLAAPKDPAAHQMTAVT